MLRWLLRRRRLRVLYALPSYPQLTESYMHNELLAVQRAGAHVEVWSGRIPTAASDEVSTHVHRGTIQEAIRAAAPDVIHIHWLMRNAEVRRAARAAGLPVTLRSHSFDFTPEAVAKLEADHSVRTIYLSPHQHAALGGSSLKARAVNPCFDPQRYGPSARKDLRCVIRTGVARPGQDHAAFIRIASRLPGFRFVLVVASGIGMEAHMEELKHLNRDLGSPVDFRTNLQYREVAPIVAGAAIYLHTLSPQKNFGMPISIAEAMATGCYLLTPDRDGASGYVGEAGTTYHSEDEALELISKTATWSDVDWLEVRERSCRRAAEQFSGGRLARTLLADWNALRA